MTFAKNSSLFAYEAKEEAVSRSTQLAGLSPKAQTLVQKPGVEKLSSGETFDGMFEETYPLHKYTMPDGTVYFEKIQAEPWSSGPVIFLALKNAKGNWIPNSLWDRNSINTC